MDKIDAEANEILKQELIAWKKKTYDEIRREWFPPHYGFTSKYLYESDNFEEFSSSAKTPTLLELAKLDLQKETTIGELVFSCCRWFPNKEAIKSMIDLQKQTETEDKVVERVLEFQDRQGFNCLISLFLYWYGELPGPLLRDIEDSCLFLIQLAKSANLDLDKILNHTTEDGYSLFYVASLHSERIIQHLLVENVQAGRIDVEANKILKLELKEEWVEKTHEEIKEYSSYGFTGIYLKKSSSAKTPTLLKLADLDLKKGESVGELVFSCCEWFPNKEAIENLVELGKQNDGGEKVVERIFEFNNYRGDNCLTILFEIAANPSGTKLRAIEETCLFLIELVKTAKLDLDKVLNHKNKIGDGLFSKALIYSEEITQVLLIEYVQLGRIDTAANEILKQELKEEWEDITYKEIRENPDSFGFMSEYLWATANFKEFSSSAKISTMLKLAELDLQKGTLIGELVFSCCRRFPKKEPLESLIELGEHREGKEKAIESVFDFQDHEGFSCLTVIFDLATEYRTENNRYPSAKELDIIEESCQYLIQLAKIANHDMEKILNHTSNSGETLFSDASIFSRNITKQLLMETNDNGKKIVQVNSINDIFLTPFFKVRLEI